MYFCHRQEKTLIRIVMQLALFKQWIVKVMSSGDEWMQTMYFAYVLLEARGYL